MKRYCLKSSVVEAAQFTGEPISGVYFDYMTNAPYVYGAPHGKSVRIQSGDWIVHEGRWFSVWGSEAFTSQYELVNP